MIEKINIGNFGCYRNYNWDMVMRDHGRNVIKFKKLNIIYGKNYSGKTTLSKIIQCLETGTIPDNYDNPRFSIVTDSGVIDQGHLEDNTQHVRVYNTEFIDRHLSFLKTADGEITPFAIMGEENKAIKNKIDEIERLLGNEKEGLGLRGDCAKKTKEAADGWARHSTADEELTAKLKNKATQPRIGIKHNPIYKDPNYNTPKILMDMALARKGGYVVLSDEERALREALLKEHSMQDISTLTIPSLDWDSLYNRVREAVTRVITPSKAIQDLLNDTVLQSWVKSGMAHHKNKRSSCGFCGQTLPDDLWDKLGQHFSEESQELERDLEGLVVLVKSAREKIDRIAPFEKEVFYPSLHKDYDYLLRQIEIQVATYRGNLDEIDNLLQTRLASIFSPLPMGKIVDNSNLIIGVLSDFNDLISKHNSKSSSLSADQNKARKELLLSEISQFALEIEYDKNVSEVEKLKISAEALDSGVAVIKGEIRKREEESDKLKTTLKDERKGAAQVNHYLNSYFGHNGLQLVSVDGGDFANATFKVIRDGKPAYNLSEGECSLVGFCYFMAKLNDADTQGKDLVIYIDDPISSLDSNHIFFIFSLIESLLAKPKEDSQGNIIKDANKKNVYKYKQLFISTHNLEFLKYLKRLSKPKNDHENILVVRSANGSEIKQMPDYLKNYVTELNYLFGEIFICSDAGNAASSHHSFYNFGNNLRKFLEAFLFFKYPFTDGDSKDHETRIRWFFGRDENTEPLVQRLINEFSHLAEFIDRSVQPIDHAEIERLANFILSKIKENDKSQYDCFLKSIGKTDPIQE
ncbi:AAA family ATPase [Chromobacterium subtsugae]|uniref:AAA family ATPase n=1 Tax=Chromobacterium subtsugae TaxID=251747 RepID=UPI000640E8A3|nr:AAA family ATPase [Chromobacterium subtsugae]